MKYLSKLIASSAFCIMVRAGFLYFLLLESSSAFSSDISSPATEAGSRPGRRPSFLARASKEGRRTRPCCLRPSGFAYGQTCVTPFRLRCRPTRCAALPLRSDKRRQVRSRCNAVLRQRCPQPEPRAAGADTRVGADTGGLRGL